MAKKQVIRLTESDLHKIIKESVCNILNERTKSEQGLTDDEVSRKRTLKFANNVNPEYGDSIYDDEQDAYMDKMYARRKQFHNKTQNHKSKMSENFDLDTYNQQKQEYNANLNNYECQLYFSEVESIRSSLTRMKVLVDKIKSGENNEMVYNYLYKQIENINDIMKNK
jgi:hypothetical protein